jgi:LmbE family N-acetylglucosaminyl deacetylase
MSTPVFEFDESLQRALVVVAHPDDVDFGAAGTVATLTQHGVHVAYCMVTSGDAGGDGSKHSKAERAAIRESEQTAAAREVGVSTVHFLHFADGEVEPTLALRRAISRVIRVERPDVVITQSPERNWERIYASHPDHLAAGEATMRAIYPDSRNPHFFPDELSDVEPHTVPEVWVMAQPATMVVDITDAFDRKVAALRQHVSQVGERDGLEEMLRTWTAGTAADNGLAEGRLAEGFRRINTK